MGTASLHSQFFVWAALNFLIFSKIQLLNESVWEPTES